MIRSLNILLALDVEVDDSEWKGDLDYQYLGLQLYASIRF